MENNNFLLRGLHTMKKAFLYLFSTLIPIFMAHASNPGKIHEDIPDTDEFLTTYANQTVDGWQFSDNWGIGIYSSLGSDTTQIFWTLKNLNKHRTTHPVRQIRVLKYSQDARRTLEVEFDKLYVQSHRLDLAQNLPNSSRFEKLDPSTLDHFVGKTFTLLSADAKPYLQKSIHHEEHLITFMLQQKWITPPLEEMLITSLVMPIKFRIFQSHIAPNTRSHLHISKGKAVSMVVTSSNGHSQSQVSRFNPINFPILPSPFPGDAKLQSRMLIERVVSKLVESPDGTFHVEHVPWKN